MEASKDSETTQHLNMPRSFRVHKELQAGGGYSQIVRRDGRKRGRWGRWQGEGPSGHGDQAAARGQGEGTLIQH